MEFMRKDQLDALSRVFLLFAREKDGNSVMTTKELHAVLSAMGSGGAAHTYTDTHAILTRVDAKGRGFIDFPEFVQLMTGTLSAVDTQAELHSAFSAMARGGDAETPTRTHTHDVADAAAVREFMRTYPPDTSVIATPAQSELSDGDIAALLEELAHSARGPDADTHTHTHTHARTQGTRPQVRIASSSAAPPAQLRREDFVAAMHAQILAP